MMKIHDNVLKQIYGVNSIGRVPEKDIIVNVFKVRAIQNYSKKSFFSSFLHRSIERELLIPKNYFLASTNISFRSTNTKNSEDIIFFKMCAIFCLILVFSFWKYFFQILHKWWSEIFYLIWLTQSYRALFFSSFLSFVEKTRFY